MLRKILLTTGTILILVSITSFSYGFPMQGAPGGFGHSGGMGGFRSASAPITPRFNIAPNSGMPSWQRTIGTDRSGFRSFGRPGISPNFHRFPGPGVRGFHDGFHGRFDGHRFFRHRDDDDFFFFVNPFPWPYFAYYPAPYYYYPYPPYYQYYYPYPLDYGYDNPDMTVNNYNYSYGETGSQNYDQGTNNETAQQTPNADKEKYETWLTEQLGLQDTQKDLFLAKLHKLISVREDFMKNKAILTNDLVDLQKQNTAASGLTAKMNQIDKLDSNFKTQEKAALTDLMSVMTVQQQAKYYALEAQFMQQQQEEQQQQQ